LQGVQRPTLKRREVTDLQQWQGGVHGQSLIRSAFAYVANDAPDCGKLQTKNPPGGGFAGWLTGV
jgi:hypothetical protein